LKIRKSNKKKLIRKIKNYWRKKENRSLKCK
jgi:hypothetical protein